MTFNYTFDQKLNLLRETIAAFKTMPYDPSLECFNPPSSILITKDDVEKSIEIMTEIMEDIEALKDYNELLEED